MNRRSFIKSVGLALMGPGCLAAMPAKANPSLPPAAIRCVYPSGANLYCVVRNRKSGKEVGRISLSEQESMYYSAPLPSSISEGEYIVTLFGNVGCNNHNYRLIGESWLTVLSEEKV